MSQRSEWLTSFESVLPTSQVSLLYKKPIEIWSLAIAFAKQSQGVYKAKVAYQSEHLTILYYGSFFYKSSTLLILAIIIILFIEMHVEIVQSQGWFTTGFFVTLFIHRFPVNNKIWNETNNIVHEQMQSFQNHEIPGWHNSRGIVISKEGVIGHKVLQQLLLFLLLTTLKIMLANCCNMHICICIVSSSLRCQCSVAKL